MISTRPTPRLSFAGRRGAPAISITAANTSSAGFAALAWLSSHRPPIHLRNQQHAHPFNWMERSCDEILAKVDAAVEAGAA
jgi:hypothetical protein